MKITDVKVHKIEKEDSRLVGVAQVIIDDCFVINSIRIIEKEDKRFIAMPSRKNGQGNYVDVAYPLNKECRQMFEEAIFEEFDK